MARGGFPGGMGGMNMNQMMKQAKKMQEQMAKMQEEMETKTYEATSGGGAVKVVIDGKRELKEIVISPEVVDPDDVEMLQDLIIAAVNEGMRKAEEENASNIVRLPADLISRVCSKKSNVWYIKGGILPPFCRIRPKTQNKICFL